MAKTVVVKTTRITASEICRKLGLDGELIMFSTPTKQSFDKIEEKELVLKLNIKNGASRRTKKTK